MNDSRTTIAGIEKPFPWLLCGIYVVAWLVAWAFGGLVFLQVADGKLQLGFT